MSEQQNFSEWFEERHISSGGLINQTVAAKIIGITDESVKRAGERGTLEVYKYDKYKFYGYEQVISYKTKREMKKIKHSNLGDNEEEMLENFLKDLEINDPDQYKVIQLMKKQGISFEPMIKRMFKTFNNK
jgi:hypothetical protein